MGWAPICLAVLYYLCVWYCSRSMRVLTAIRVLAACRGGQQALGIDYLWSRRITPVIANTECARVETERRRWRKSRLRGQSSPLLGVDPWSRSPVHNIVDMLTGILQVIPCDILHLDFLGNYLLRKSKISVPSRIRAGGPIVSMQELVCEFRAVRRLSLRTWKE